MRGDWQKTLGADLPASLVLFFVALPLCLGIALASGAPLVSGLIAGAIGGLIVGALSGSALGVSGPAAGLVVIVVNAIEQLGGYPSFLAAVVVAGVLQIMLGYLRAGLIGYFFPNSVINGMLTGIGILIIFKQVPYALGITGSPVDGFVSETGLVHELAETVGLSRRGVHLGAILISLASLFILFLWDSRWLKAFWWRHYLEAPLVVVVVSFLLTPLLSLFPSLILRQAHFVRVPNLSRLDELADWFVLPAWSAFLRPEVYLIGATLALVASLETLLSVEASDKQDPLKRVTPTNRELKAQGVGNVLSGLLGGLPITQVVVRSSVNVQAGGVSRLSTCLHGLFLVLSVLILPKLLNQIPLSALAAILISVGFKLTNLKVIQKTWRQGLFQFLPFASTAGLILVFDLLVGVGVGFALALFFLLRTHYQSPIELKAVHGSDSLLRLELGEEVSFLKKARLRKLLAEVPDGSQLVIDGTKTRSLDPDVMDILEDFVKISESRSIQVSVISLKIG